MKIHKLSAMRLRSTSRAALRIGTAAVALALSTTAAAQSAHNTWNGGFSTDWSMPLNWSHTTAPSKNGQIAVVGSSHNPPMVRLSTVSASTLYVGSGLSADLQITMSGTLDVDNLIVGNSTNNAALPGIEGESGRITAFSLGRLISSDLTLGYYGTGTINLQMGSSAEFGHATLGTMSSGLGTLSVASSSFSADSLSIGADGRGAVYVDVGSTAVTGNAALGVNTGSYGYASVSGANSKWENTGVNFSIGGQGEGVLNVSGGASVSGAKRVSLGTSSGGMATLFVSGTDSSLTAGTEMMIGQSGTAFSHIMNGGHATADKLIIGFNDQSSGALNIQGAGSQAEGTSYVMIGYGGKGTVTLSDGGTLKADGPRGITIGFGATGNGLLNIGAGLGEEAAAAGYIDSASGIIFGDGLGMLHLNHTDTDYNLSAPISGYGVITIAAGTTNFSGDNSNFSGPLVAHGGKSIISGDMAASWMSVGSAAVLQIGNGGATGTLAADVENDGVLIFDRSDALTHSRVITGTGAVSVTRGDITLTGMNTYTGGTSVAAGAQLNLLGQGRINQSSLVTVDGVFDVTGASSAQIQDLRGTGTVVVGGSSLHILNASQNFAGNITGVGGVMVTGGSLTLTGDNDFEGGMGISDGALVTIGNGSHVGSVASSITNYGTLVFDHSAGHDYTGNLTGQGNVIKRGAGTLFFTGAMSGLSLDVTEGAAVFSGTVSNSNINVSANSLLGFANPAATTYRGKLSGSGIVAKTGQGTTTFSGDSSGFAGQTFTSEGKLIVTGTLGGTLGVLAGAVAQVGNGKAAGTLDGDVGNNGTLIFNRSDAIEYGGNIYGTGGVTIASGVVALNASNTFTGATDISQGATLALASNGSIAQSSIVNIDGTLDLTHSGLVQIKDISGDGVITLGNPDLILTNAAGTFSGTITGDGGVFLEGGSLTLTGTNDFANTLRVADNATVNLGGGSSSGSVTANITAFGTVIFDRTENVTYAGQIGGPGSIVKTGSNAMAFTGILSGVDLSVDEGVAVFVGEVSNVDAHVAADAILGFANPGETTYQGDITGSGHVIKAGAGATTLFGDSSAFTGNTTVAEGSLILTGRLGGQLLIEENGTFQIGNGKYAGDLLADTENNGTLVFDLGDIEYDYAGSLSGTGGLIKRGEGTVLLSGDYSYTGTTKVEAGLIRLTSSLDNATSLQLDGGIFDLGGRDQTIAGIGGEGGTLIIGVGALTLNLDGGQHGFGGAIAGNGGINVNAGSGSLNLTGNSSFSGAVNINEGTVFLNGSMGGQIFVHNSGTLGGSGVVGDIIARNGGVVAPGNSIGTLTAAGNITFEAGSTYSVEVDAEGDSDRINVAGRANIDSSATVSVLAAAGNYRRSSDYVILSADGGIDGRFSDEVDVDLPFLTPALGYSENDVTLTLIRNDRSFASTASTRNQLAVAQALDLSDSSSVLYRSIAGQTDTAGAVRAFNTLSGELWATTGTFMIDRTRQLGEMVTGRMEQADVISHALSHSRIASRNARDGRTGIWGQATGSWNTIKGDGNVSSAKQNGAGVITGIDTSFGNWRVGVAFSHGEDKIRVNALDSEATVTGTALAGYVGGGWNNLRIRLGGSYGWLDMKGTRKVIFPSVTENVTASFDGKTASAFAELSYGASLGSVQVEPFAGVNHVHIRTDGFTEIGGALAALDVDSQKRDVTYTTLGLRLGTVLPVSDQAAITPRASAAWVRGFGDVAANSRHSLSTGQAFSIEGLRSARDTLRLEAGAQANILPGGSLGIAYVGNVADRWSDHGLKLGFSYSF